MKIKILTLIAIILPSITTISAESLLPKSSALLYAEPSILTIGETPDTNNLMSSEALYSGSENDTFFNSFDNNSNNKYNCISIETGGSILGALTAIAVSLPLSSMLEDTSRKINRNLITHPSISSLVLTPILTSIGASLTGKILKQKGSYPKSLCGSLLQGLILSAIGATAGVIVGTAENMIKEREPNSFFVITGASLGWELGTIYGSAQGYNWK
ncbi:MAG: hypothetical protein PHE49_08955 [bacterium]|nr:hypothetical protein [bacterium]